MLLTNLPHDTLLLEDVDESISESKQQVNVIQQRYRQYTPYESSPLATTSSSMATSPVKTEKKKKPLYLNTEGGYTLVFDLQTMKQLTISTNIIGQLVGTLPLAPQQNSFLGLPWRLSIYETLWLIENEWGYLVNNNDLGLKFIADLANDGDNNQLSELLCEDSDFRLQKQREEKKRQLAERLRKFGTNIKKNNSSMPNLNDGLPRRPETASDFSRRTTRPSHNGGTDIVFMETDNDEARVQCYWDNLLNDVNHDNEIMIETLIKPEVDSQKTIYKTKEMALQKIQLNYALFKHLKDVKAMCLLPGMRFGGTFVAYPGDPLRYHAQWIVESREFYSEDIGLGRLANRGRLATGVKKKYLIGGQKKLKSAPNKEKSSKYNVFNYSDANETEIVTFTVEWAGF